MTASRLAALHAQCFETPRPWSEAEIEAVLTAPETFLCERTDGFALGRVIFDEAELLTLAVAPSARRRGLGRRLLDEFADSAVLRGATTAFLEVSVENTAALGLYRAAGYSQTGWRKGYFRTPTGHRIDALVLGRDLSSCTPPGT